MNAVNKLTLTVTRDKCHYEVIGQFKKLIENPELKLCVITSDIDNLGIHISRFGRAFGQNLVDYWTNCLIQFVYSEYHTEVKKGDLIIIPAGEEISIFSLNKSEFKINEFFKDLCNKVNKELLLFEPDKVKCQVTFGMQIINDIKIHNKIKLFN